MYGETMFFQWILPQKLAISSQPKTIEDYRQLVKERITQAINLREYPIEEIISDWPIINREIRFKYYHIGTTDGAGFTPEQFSQHYEIITQAITNNIPILLHCSAGGGRTSTALTAFWMKYRAITLENAFNELVAIKKLITIDINQQKNMEKIFTIYEVAKLVLTLTDHQMSSLKEWDYFLKKNLPQ